MTSAHPRTSTSREDPSLPHSAAPHGQLPSAHSSTTHVDIHTPGRAWTKSPAAFIEHEVETYGGDAPFDPVLKRPGTGSTLTQGAGSGEGSREGSGEEERLSKVPPAAVKAEEDPNRVQFLSNDPEDPLNLPLWYKWCISGLTIMMAMNVTFASSAPSAGLVYIANEFQISLVAANLVTSLMLFGYCVGPIIWAPLSEMYGRRWVLIISYGGYCLWQIGGALAHNTGTLLVSRFFAGAFASSALTVTAGVTVDIFDPVRRQISITLFSASVFLGPVLGPIVGGFVAEAGPHMWRWIFWIIMIWSGVATVILVFCLPETFAPVLLARRAKKMRAEDPVKNKDVYADHEHADFSIKSIITRTIMRPFIMLFTESILFLTTLYMAVVYGLLYSLFSAFPIIFAEVRGFSAGITGLMFIPVGLGTTLGAALNYYLQRDGAFQLKKWKGFPPPEYRLRGGMWAGPAIVIGSLWLGWAGNYPNVHWIVPALGAVVLGTTFTLVFISFLTYTTEVYLMYASSALAANTVLRSAAGAAFPLFTDQMYAKLGIGWACTLVAGIGLLLAPVPFLFYRYGRSIRVSSKFAPALDTKITPDEESGELKDEKA